MAVANEENQSNGNNNDMVPRERERASASFRGERGRMSVSKRVPGRGGGSIFIEWVGGRERRGEEGRYEEGLMRRRGAREKRGAVGRVEVPGERVQLSRLEI